MLLGITRGSSDAFACGDCGAVVHTAAITVCGYGAIPSLPTLDKVEALMQERGYDELDNKLDAL